MRIRWGIANSSVSKPCQNCGIAFSPVARMSEKKWNSQRFCGKSCSKKAENPMHDNGARLRMIDSLKRIGHKPSVRGGNGFLTEPQREMVRILGEPWICEHAVPTKKPRGSGYPTCYKLDVANPSLLIGIELEGTTHTGKGILKDIKKDSLLYELGWKVYRIKNQAALTITRSAVSAEEVLRRVGV